MDNNVEKAPAEQTNKKTKIIIAVIIGALIVVGATIATIAIASSSYKNNTTTSTQTEITTDAEGNTTVEQGTTSAGTSDESTQVESATTANSSSSNSSGNSGSSNSSSSSNTANSSSSANSSNESSSNNSASSSSSSSSNSSSSGSTGDSSNNANTAPSINGDANADINVSSYKAGDKIKVSYYLKSEVNFCGIQCDVNYDSSVLKVDSSSVDISNLAGAMSNPDAENKIKFLASAATAVNDFTKEKLLFSCEFEVLKTASSDVTINIIDILDNDVLSIPSEKYTITSKVEKL